MWTLHGRKNESLFWVSLSLRRQDHIWLNLKKSSQNRNADDLQTWPNTFFKKILLVRFGLLSGHLSGKSGPLSWPCVLIVLCLFVILVIFRFGFEGGVCFLAHLSQRLICELIGYPCPGVRRRPSVRNPSVRQSSSTISNVFFSETAWPIKAKFYVEPPWEGGGAKVYINGPGHMTMMAAIPIYGKNI